MADDHTFPQHGDEPDAANWAQLTGQSNGTDYVESGLQITNIDWTVPEFDITAGTAFIKADLMDTAHPDIDPAETRTDVGYAVEKDSKTSIGLTDDAVNYVFLDANRGTDDFPQLFVKTDDVAPTDASIKIAEIDTANGTITELNRDPDGSFELLSANKLLGVPVAGSSEFATVQEAVEFLPASGGKILLREPVSETATTIDKPVTIEGVNGYERASGDVTIDTSGGDGLYVTNPDVTLRDLTITGDGTGGYGLRSEVGGLTLDDVGIAGNGGNNLEIVGPNLSHKLKTTLKGAGQHGLYVEITDADNPQDYFSESEVWVSAFDNAQDGVRVAQPTEGGNIFAGITFTNLHSAGNGGWGMYVEDGVSMTGVTLDGYGMERNGAGALYCMDAGYGRGNVLNLSTMAGDVETTQAIWSSVNSGIDLDGRLIGYAQGEVDYYIRDDFGDDGSMNYDPNIGVTGLNAREGRISGNYRTDYGEVVPGCYRPPWKWFQGSPSRDTKGLKFPAKTGDPHCVEFPAAMTRGTFEWTLEYSSVPMSGATTLQLYQNEDNTNVYVWASAGGDLRLSYFDGDSYPSIITGSWSVDTNSHTVRVERDPANPDSWELFLDGASIGTGMQSFAENPDVMQLKNSTDAEMYVTDVHHR